MKRTPKPSAYIPTTIALLVLGFGGLMIIMNATDPLLGARWLFFLLVVVAFTGVALPASAWLNYRFPSQPPASANVIVRQALWFGVYVSVISWLSYGRVINIGLAGLFLIGFTAIEIFIRMWENSKWRKP
jgi:hypothetical protein